MNYDAVIITIILTCAIGSVLASLRMWRETDKIEKKRRDT